MELSKQLILNQKTFTNIEKLITYALILFSFFLGTGLEKMTINFLLCFAFLSLLNIKKNIFKFQEFLQEKIFYILYFIIVFYAIIFKEFIYIERNVSFLIFPFLILYVNRELILKKRIKQSICLFFALGLISYPLFIIIYYIIHRIETETGLVLNITNLYEVKRVVFSKNIFNHSFHNVYYSIYSICSILFLFYLFKKSKYFKYICVIIFIHLIFIFIAASRTSYFITLIVLFYIINVSLSLKKRIYIIPGVLFILFVLIKSYEYLNYKFVRDLPRSLDFRLEVWSNSFKIFNENVLGLGFKGYHRELNLLNNQSFSSELNNTNYNGHNLYIEYFCSLGVLGGLVFLLLIFKIYKRAIIKNNSILLLFMIILSLSFLTESWLVRQNGIVFFMFFVMIFWNFENEKIIS